MKISKPVIETLRTMIIGEQDMIIKHIDTTKLSENQLSETCHFFSKWRLD